MMITEVPTQLAEMFHLYNHVPQAVVVIVGSNDLGKISKAQLRAYSKDMLMDITALWVKSCPEPKLKIGLFVLLMHVVPELPGYTDQ